MTEPEVSVSRALTLRPARAARADGCRVLLTGTAGDQVLGGEPYHTPVMLRDVPASRLAGELPHFLRYSRRSPASLLVDAYLRPAAPAPLRRLVRRLRARGPAALPARAATVAGDLLAPPPLASRSSQASYRALTEGAFSACLSSFDLAGRHLGVEWRFPFLDRRLIDYTLGLPARLRFRGGMIKLILRQAMAGILAEPVHFQELVERGLGDRERGRVKDLLASSRAVAHGLVEGAAIAAAWEAYWRDELAAFDARRLTGFLCVEAWLRRQERPACAPGPREDVGRAFDNEPALVL